MADDEKKEKSEESEESSEKKFDGDESPRSGDADGSEGNKEGQAGDVESGENQMVASVAQGMAELKAMLTAVFSLLTGAGGSMAVTENPSNLAPVKPVTQMRSGDAEASLKAREADLAAREASFAARLGAVESALKAQKESAEVESRFQSAMEELSGRNIPDPVKSALRTAAAGDPAMFRATLDVVKTTLPYDPPEYRDHYHAAPVTAMNVAELPEEVQKAMSMGKGEDAIKQFRAYESYRRVTQTRPGDIDFARFQKIDALRNASLGRG